MSLASNKPPVSKKTKSSSKVMLNLNREHEATIIEMFVSGQLNVTDHGASHVLLVHSELKDNYDDQSFHNAVEKAKQAAKKILADKMEAEKAKSIRNGNIDGVQCTYLLIICFIFIDIMKRQLNVLKYWFNFILLKA